jgi:uncharacterized RDD family membrane protein YckC
MNLYYTFINNDRQGPFSFEEILSKRLSENDLIWRNGLDDWIPLNQLPEYLAYIPPPVPVDLEQNINKKCFFSYEDEPTPIIAETIIENFIDRDLDKGKPSYPGISLRIGAFLIDFIILLFICSLILANYNLSLDRLGLVIEEYFYGIVILLIWLISGWLYSSAFECSKFQATPGKLIVGLKVTDWQSKRINFKKSSLRYLGKIVTVLTLGIGFIMINKSGINQGFHDNLFHTQVSKGNTTGKEGIYFAWSALVFSVILIILSLIISGNDIFENVYGKNNVKSDKAKIINNNNVNPQKGTIKYNDGDNKIKTLYDKIIATGKVTAKEIGDFDTFSKLMTDSVNVRIFYENLISQSIATPNEIGDFDTFYNYIKRNLPSAENNRY